MFAFETLLGKPTSDPFLGSSQDFQQCTMVFLSTPGSTDGGVRKGYSPRVHRLTPGSTGGTSLMHRNAKANLVTFIAISSDVHKWPFVCIFPACCNNSASFSFNLFSDHRCIIEWTSASRAFQSILLLTSISCFN